MAGTTSKALIRYYSFNTVVYLVYVKIWLESWTCCTRRKRACKFIAWQVKAIWEWYYHSSGKFWYEFNTRESVIYGIYKNAISVVHCLFKSIQIRRSWDVTHQFRTLRSCKEMKRKSRYADEKFRRRNGNRTSISSKPYMCYLKYICRGYYWGIGTYSLCS